jgi:hypothetical protein
MCNVDSESSGRRHGKKSRAALLRWLRQTGGALCVAFGAFVVIPNEATGSIQLVQESSADPLLNVVGRFFVGCFFIQRFLQLPFSLMIELLIPALGLSGLLPEFVGAADNFYSKGPSHSRCLQMGKHNPS